MLFRFAVRSLGVRPVRTAILACGFGLGIAVMAELLGIGEVILDQARAPALRGGGDLVVSGAFGAVDNARFLLSDALASTRAGSPVAAASPTRRAMLYLVKDGTSIPIVARGGVPSLEKTIGDPEVRDAAAWVDRPADEKWTKPDAGDVLRTMDRFHRVPDLPEFASSWAEWLYFNGRSADGQVRFYLTFLVGPAIRPGTRAAGVRLQLDRGGDIRNYSARADVDEERVLRDAPNLDIGANQVRLDELRYHIRLRLRAEDGASELIATLTLDPARGRSLPPMVIRGARGWMSGYVVPVLAGRVDGELTTGSHTVRLTAADAYHDHNWGFWRDVRWQWGQVSGGDIAIVFGRVFPPAEVADPDRMPGFLGVLDREGLVGVTTNVAISERTDNGTPAGIAVVGSSGSVDVRLKFATERAIRTRMAMTGATTDFLQLSGTYQVEGRAGERQIRFTARGAAETFQPR
jgi:hypothetical protein